jgi:hypothetical protein
MTALVQPLRENVDDYNRVEGLPTTQLNVSHVSTYSHLSVTTPPRGPQPLRLSMCTVSGWQASLSGIYSWYNWPTSL